MESIVCPKCHGPMRHYERSGVTVDQCTECRGIFLDRGELERLIDAENAWAKSVNEQPPTQPAQQYAPPPQQQYAPPPQQYQQPYPPQQGYYGKPYKKRKSFLEELFD